MAASVSELAHTQAASAGAGGCFGLLARPVPAGVNGGQAGTLAAFTGTGAGGVPGHGTVLRAHLAVA